MKKINVKYFLLFLCCLFVVASSCTSEGQKKVRCERVSVEAFAEAISSGAVHVIDVRTPEETDQGIIDGAALLDFRSQDFADKLADLDRDQSYGIYCKGGGRSAKALKQMESLGFSNVIELEGGYDAYLKHIGK